ncbi:MAG: hypothetical protein KGZ85_16065 [Ignavibacterium sp.]|nr:hypothetical protein [Ignavibacterium sp.]
MLSKVNYTIIISLFSIAVFAQSQNNKLLRDVEYSQWLKSGTYRTDQTSGIAFLGYKSGKKTFLIADDIGALHKFVIIDDCVFLFYPIHFNDYVSEFFKDYPKIDFEEIVYDRYEEKFYVSVEGHTENHNDYTGIFELEFNFALDTVISVTKINFEPEELFLKYTAWNIGYEGLTVDSRYFYLGLEGFLRGKAFSDSSVIFIADKTSKEIIKEISTSSLGVGSITGLYSDEDYSVWLLDRNNLKIFHVEFDEDLNVENIVSFDFEPVIPNHKHLNYVGSYEALTIDNDGYLYIVDDPWSQFFIPPDNILEQLDEKTVQNFKDFIPIIDRFQIQK